MRDALVLGHSLNRRVPAIGPQAGGVVEGKTEIVAEFGAGYALGLVFVIARGPFAGKVDLSEGRKAGQEQKNADCGSISSGHQGAASVCQDGLVTILVAFLSSYKPRFPFWRPE